MAPDLKRWAGGTAGACLIVALGALVGSGGASLPPENPPLPSVPRWSAEAGRLAGLWQATWSRWRLESYRDRLAAAADSARAAGGASPLLLVDGPSTPAQRAEMNGYLGQIWRAAAPGGFKVAVALVVDRSAGPRDSADLPPIPRGQGVRYVFPDSLHRDLCLAVVHDEYSARRFFDPRRTQPLGLASEFRWIAQSLGPCAFYGAYGVPSRQIGAWIDGQGYQFAMYPRWWRPGEGSYGIWWDRSVPIARQPASWWGYLYSELPWDGVRCYAGRPGRCAAAVYDGAAVQGGQPATWSTFRWWENQSLFGSTYYLSDLARALGPERFARFWTADTPMDSAVYLASGETLDHWTADWARGRGMRLRLGPTAPPLDAGVGLCSALLALGAALWYAGRRQIG